MNPWPYIRAILGPGSHWMRSHDDLDRAIARAERDRQLEAADHLRLIQEQIDIVNCDEPKKTPLI